MNVYTLQSHEAIARWHEIEPLIEPATIRGMPLEQIRELIANAQAQVWCAGVPVAFVMVTQISGDTGVWLIAGGKLNAMPAFVRLAVEAWFRERGCKRVRMVGRRGWKRILDDYAEIAVILEKSL